MKNILIINGHPNSASFCASLANNYFKGAIQSGASCAMVNLADLNFNPILKYGYQKRTDLEPDLLETWKKIEKADHLVWVYPNWWGTYPALLKGFIDRLFLPGIAFSPKENSMFFEKHLKGKTARVIVTMDSPNFYYRLLLGKPGHRSMEDSILKFCGVKPVKFKTFNGIKNASEFKKEKWLESAFNLGLHMN